VRPGQAGEDDEIQQGQVQGPAPGEEQRHAPVQAQGWPAGEQLCGEGPGSAGGRQVNHEPAVCPGYQEGQWDPGVHQEECGQQDEGGSLSPLRCPSEAPSGVLCPVLGSPGQERWGATEESPAEGYENDEGIGASILWVRAEGAGLV